MGQRSRVGGRQHGQLLIGDVGRDVGIEPSVDNPCPEAACAIGFFVFGSGLLQALVVDPVVAVKSGPVLSVLV